MAIHAGVHEYLAKAAFFAFIGLASLLILVIILLLETIEKRFDRLEEVLYELHTKDSVEKEKD
jgi:hypothetical protein